MKDRAYLDLLLFKSCSTYFSFSVVYYKLSHSVIYFWWTLAAFFMELFTWGFSWHWLRLKTSHHGFSSWYILFRIAPSWMAVISVVRWELDWSFYFKDPVYHSFLYSKLHIVLCLELYIDHSKKIHAKETQAKTKTSNDLH